MTTTFQSLMAPPLPRVHDAAAASLFWHQLAPPLQAQLAPHQAFLEGVAAGSPYLRGLMLAHPGLLADVFTRAPSDVLDGLCAACVELGRTATEAEARPALRALKGQAALLIALADLANVWDLDAVTGALTRFADCCLAAAIDVLLRAAAGQGRFNPADLIHPSHGSGFVALAMGKHGAFELNYSSDIDIIVLYDPDAAPLAEGVEPARFFVKLTQQLVSLLQDITADGYVFRCDLRLRPDPRATQVAIAIEAAAIYYENMGQNWERAAYIKARAAAGDIALGEEFLARLRPYIWRKYLDFAAIADVQSLIRQIHAVKGHGEIAVEGHNLKLGRGGIREIEFFVQTQQLIAGGRNAALRGRRTKDMLATLAEAGWIAPDTALELSAAYDLLRRLEHRAQMVDDQQTHAVPPAGEAFDSYAAFCGYATPDALRQAVRTTLELVRKHSSRLFEQASDLGGETGALVFTGGEDDPETLLTLHRMGYRQASEVSAVIRGWHFGRYAATRDRRAREALTELMPALLAAMSRAGDADRTFLDFDRFLKGLPAGVQLFAMLKANPGLLDLLAQILGTAPRLAEGLSRQPRVLEAVLDPAFFGPLPPLDALHATLQAQAPDDLSLDEAMDRVRVFVREQKFRVGVRVLSETVTAEDAGRGFANVADAALAHLLRAVERDIATNHGKLAGGEVAVIAMGKLGGREMTAASDLDLILVYAHAADAELSDGRRALAPNPYFARLAQRFVTAVSVPTAEGMLYDVDMRLRPSGSKGPVAVSLASFEAYQADSAWTWEKLALTRARVVAGAPALAARIAAAVQTSLCAPRDVAQTTEDVVSMRGLMLREHKPQSVWDIKRIRGGLVELEFIAQYLQLVHAPGNAAVLDTNTALALDKLAQAGALPAADHAPLLAACRLYHRMTQILRLCLDGDYDAATALPGLNRALALAAGTPDVRAADDLLRHSQAQVAAIFDRLIGVPQPATDSPATAV